MSFSKTLVRNKTTDTQNGSLSRTSTMEFEDEASVSPYISASCKIFFHNGTPFIVPRDLLKASDALLASCDALYDLDLRNIPDDAGHVLVHYLYTGTWQTLRERTLGDSLAVKLSHFKISVHVYCAARAYSLPGLVKFAQASMKELAFYLPKMAIIVSASSACHLLPDGDEWFETFLHRHVKEMFRLRISLDQSTFMESFQGATSYSKLLAKSMFKLCCENSGRYRTFSGDGASFVWEVLGKTAWNESEAVVGVQEEHHLLSGSQAEPSHDEAPAFESPALDDWAVAETSAGPGETPRESAETDLNKTVNYFLHSPSETGPMEAANTINSPAKKSKKEKKKAKKLKAAKKNEGVLKGSSAESVSVSERILEPEPESEIEPIAVEEASGLKFNEGGDMEESEPVPEEPVPEPAPEPESNSTIIEDPWDQFLLAKKEKKRLKKLKKESELGSL